MSYSKLKILLGPEHSTTLLGDIMKKVIVILVATIVTLATSSAFARNVWRDCGIGAMLFKNTGWAAITSNIIWDWGTTATSSNVSSSELCEGSGKASTAKFINENFANLEEQTATGSGEHVSSMLNNLGCETQSHGAIIDTVSADLKNTVTTAAYAEKTTTQKAEVYYNTVVQTVDNKFAQSCQNIQ